MKCAENLTELYADIDDFLKIFLPEFKKRLISDGRIKRNRATQMSESEIMTLLIYFQRSKYKDFKAFYLCKVYHEWRKEFPKLLSYERFIKLIPRVFIPMTAYLKSRQANSAGSSGIWAITKELDFKSVGEFIEASNFKSCCLS